MSPQTAQFHYAVFRYGMSKRIGWYDAACVAIALALCFKIRKGIAVGPRNGTYREAVTPVHYASLFGNWK